MIVVFWGGLTLAVVFALGTFVIIHLERKAERKYWEQRVEEHEKAKRD